jgi:hypothetical protein
VHVSESGIHSEPSGRSSVVDVAATWAADVVVVEFEAIKPLQAPLLQVLYAHCESVVQLA